MTLSGLGVKPACSTRKRVEESDRPAAPAFPLALAGAMAPWKGSFPLPEQRTDSALLHTRLATALGSAYLDALVLSTRTGTQVEARGMGLQLRLPQHKGELLIGRHVSGGAGLRPDLPLVGVRYSQRVLPSSRPAAGTREARQSRTAPVPPPPSPSPAGPRITVPVGSPGEKLGALEVTLLDPHAPVALAPPAPGLRLLPPGASDLSLAAGMLALDAERFESTYLPAAALSVRHGWRGQQTVSAHAVQVGETRLLSGFSEFGWVGVTTAGATLRERGQGMEPGWVLAHEYQVLGFMSRLRFDGLRAGAAPGGNSLLGPPHRRNSEFTLSWALNPRRSFSVTAGDRLRLEGERTELLALSSSLGWSSGTQLSLGLKYLMDGIDSTQFTLDWRLPLEGGRTGRRSARPWTRPTAILR